jgi:hypothetical protein
MLFVVSTAILIGRFARSFPIQDKSNLWSRYYGISLFVATAFICWAILVAPMTDARSFESYQKAIRAEARQHPEMYGTTVSRVDKFSVAENFAVTMVDLRVSDRIAIKHVLTSDRAPDNIEAEIVEKTSAPHPECNLIRDLG